MTTLEQKWRTAQLIGEAKHQAVVRVRPGQLERNYMGKMRIDNGRVPRNVPMIYKGQNLSPWQGIWTPLGDWETLPNIQSVRYTRGFDQNGSSTLTVLMDNIAFIEVAGDVGSFHQIVRGYFSPSRGIAVGTRPDLWTNTGWGDVLNGGYQIEVWEGYGPDGDPSVIPLDVPGSMSHSCAPPDSNIKRTFTGLVEDCDLESHPDHITLTARDFGVLFTDQRLQGTNKASEIIAPTFFADRRKTLGEVEVDATLPPTKSFGTAAASSEFNADGTGLTGWVENMHPGYATHEEAFAPGGWWSMPQSGPTGVQWLQMALKAGEYVEFACTPGISGMTMWVSVLVGPGGGMVDGVPHAPGWVGDGSGLTPDGTPYLGVWHDVPPEGDCHAGEPLPFNHDLTLPDDSILRVTFTNLSFEDPVYDKAPPFPYDFYNKLMALIDISIIDWSSYVKAAKANLAFAQKQVRGMEAFINKHPALKQWQNEAVIFFGYWDTLYEPPRLVFANPSYDGESTGLWESGQDADPNHSWNPAFNLAFFKAEVPKRQKILADTLKLQHDQEVAVQKKNKAYPEAEAMLRYYDKLWEAYKTANPGYYAIVHKLSAFRFGDPNKDEGQSQLDPSWAPVNATHWVLTDDAADVIVMLCLWLGFKEWNIDPFGWHLINPMQWGSDKFFIDVVNDMLAQGNYVFFMGPPTNDDRSIGVPCFLQQSAAGMPSRNMIPLSDADMIEASEVKWDLSNLPGLFRYRGDPVPDVETVVQWNDQWRTEMLPSPAGATWEEDLVVTWQAIYTPPWAPGYVPLGGELPRGAVATSVPDRIAGIMRHFTQTEGVNVTIGLQSNEECLFACVLAAIQYAIAMCTGKLQIAGRPGIGLNDQIDVIEQANAINSRMWVAAIESTHTLGEKGKWDMVVSGSYTDTEDMNMLHWDYWTAYRRMLAARGANPCPTPTTPPPTFYTSSG